MSESMIERVARAIYSDPSDYGDERLPWDEWDHHDMPEIDPRDSFRRLARAAIEAMRTPTKAMLDAYDANACAGGDPNAAINLASYDDMIDAALSEKP